jgi:hypothetical protein
MGNETNTTFVKRLLMPVGQQKSARKVWSIDLESVWIPFFTATNTEGCSAISPDALGCPLRLGYAKDGSVRFSQSGKPVIRVAKELSDNVRIVRENFTATLISHTEAVQAEMPTEYEAMQMSSVNAGKAIAKVDGENLNKANALRLEAMAESVETPAVPAERELVTA